MVHKKGVRSKRKKERGKLIGGKRGNHMEEVKRYRDLRKREKNPAKFFGKRGGQRRVKIVKRGRGSEVHN